MECTEIFESHKSDKGLTSKMYKEPLKYFCTFHELPFYAFDIVYIYIISI
jgi:hypothetical protein